MQSQLGYRTGRTTANTCPYKTENWGVREVKAEKVLRNWIFQNPFSDLRQFLLRMPRTLWSQAGREGDGMMWSRELSRSKSSGVGTLTRPGTMATLRPFNLPWAAWTLMSPCELASFVSLLIYKYSVRIKIIDALWHYFHFKIPWYLFSEILNKIIFKSWRAFFFRNFKFISQTMNIKNRASSKWIRDLTGRTRREKPHGLDSAVTSGAWRLRPEHPGNAALLLLYCFPRSHQFWWLLPDLPYPNSPNSIDKGTKVWVSLWAKYVSSDDTTWGWGSNARGVWGPIGHTWDELGLNSIGHLTSVSPCFDWGERGQRGFAFPGIGVSLEPVSTIPQKAWHLRGHALLVIFWGCCGLSPITGLEQGKPCTLSRAKLSYPP